ncbi:hypothetical protein [Pyrococcus kukulkanii]|uniref:Uncharacterized protein n=1 Tax=Pyrococcus kukulkanii TaxID=1609559 RepID=A0A127B804_9EURY|nr:hypothetical protein [Pyrococcus kukulkanii]AMM53500.1 hypothetical protein TQ32_02595 [Pyrococcus kukulkanii]
MSMDFSSGIGDSLEDVIGSILLSLMISIFGFIISIMIKIGYELGAVDVASWTLEVWSLYVGVVGIVDLISVFGLGELGFVKPIMYVIGRIFGYFYAYQIFSKVGFDVKFSLINAMILLLALFIRISKETQNIM